MTLKIITEVCTAIGAIATTLAPFFIFSQASDSSRQIGISSIQLQSDNLSKRIELVKYIQNLETARLTLIQWSALLKITSNNAILAFIEKNCATSEPKLCATNGLEVAIDMLFSSFREPPYDPNYDPILSTKAKEFIIDAGNLLNIHEFSVTILTSQNLSGDIRSGLDVCSYFVPDGSDKTETMEKNWEEMQLSQKLATLLTNIRDNSLRFLDANPGIPFPGIPFSELLQITGPAKQELKASLISLRNLEEARLKQEGYHSMTRAPTDVEALKWGIYTLKEEMEKQIKSCDTWLAISITKDLKLRNLLESDLETRVAGHTWKWW